MKDLRQELGKPSTYPPSWYLSEGATVVGEIKKATVRLIHNTAPHGFAR
jgi:hypothetical protein